MTSSRLPRSSPGRKCDDNQLGYYSSLFLLQMTEPLVFALPTPRHGRYLFFELDGCYGDIICVGQRNVMHDKCERVNVKYIL